MRNYLLIDNNFEEVAEYTPGCWVNVECPDNNDISFLTDRKSTRLNSSHWS